MKKDLSYILSFSILYHKVSSETQLLYSRLFPSKLKEHLSHDVLLMCIMCHQIANVHNAQLKQEIESEHNVPLSSSQKFKEDPRLLKVKNHAR